MRLGDLAQPPRGGDEDLLGGVVDVRPRHTETAQQPPHEVEVLGDEASGARVGGLAGPGLRHGKRWFDHRLDVAHQGVIARPHPTDHGK